MKKDVEITLSQAINKFTHSTVNYCISRNISCHDAEEITQEIMIILIEKWDKLDKSNIRAWIYGTARNLIYQYREKKAKEYNNSYIEDIPLKEEPYVEDDFNFINGNIGFYEYIQNRLDSFSENEKLILQHITTQKYLIEYMKNEYDIPRSTTHDRLKILKKKLIKMYNDYQK